MFDNLDINKDGLVSDGEFAMFKVNSDTITSDKLVKAGFSKSDADALVKKYTQEGKNSFTKDDVDTKDNQSQVNTKDSNTKKDGITVGGVIALISFFLCIVGIIAWGIWWLNKDDKKEQENTTEIKEIKNDAENNLETIDAKGKTTIIK